MNNNYPNIVQNEKSFQVLEPLLQSGDIKVETASEYDGGRSVFGCFKINNTFKVLDDSIDHYFILVNDHLKPDGKVLVLNTPVRIVCQNALSSALAASVYSLRMPVVDDINSTASIAKDILGSVDTAIRNLNRRADKMATQKISSTQFERVMDELFPFLEVPEGVDSAFSKANETVEMIRDTFIHDCMDAPNLANYSGTVFQVYNALTDYSQHYFKNATKGYDLNHKMSLLPKIGSGSETEASKVTKFLKMAKDFAA